MLQRLVASTSPTAAASPDSSKKSKKGKKASPADKELPVAAAVVADESEWLPDLMAALCEKVRSHLTGVDGHGWGWLASCMDCDAMSVLVMSISVRTYVCARCPFRVMCGYQTAKIAMQMCDAVWHSGNHRHVRASGSA